MSKHAFIKRFSIFVILLSLDLVFGTKRKGHQHLASPNLIRRVLKPGYHNLEEKNKQIPSSTCIDTEAWEHSTNLFHNTLADIGVYDTELKATDSKIPGSAILISGPQLPHHRYIMHARPTLSLNDVKTDFPPLDEANSYVRNCFDPRNVQYEKDLNLVTELSEEFIAGCTPFRKIAMILNKFHIALTSEFNKVFNSADIEIDLKVLGVMDKKMIISILKTYNPSYEDEEEMILSTLVNGLVTHILNPVYNSNVAERNIPKKTTKEMERIANEIITKSLAGQYETMNTPSDLRNSLYCLPALAGSVGVESSKGIDVYDNSRNTPYSPNSYVGHFKKCDIPPMCARLATAELLNFHKTYKYGLRSEGDGTGISYKKCLTTKETTDVLYSNCWAKAVRHVCVKYRVCCPSNIVYEACQENTRSNTCKSICHH